MPESTCSADERRAEAAASIVPLSVSAPGGTVRPFPRQTPSEALARFQEVVASAVDHFNKESLDRAAVLLELAERWQAEQAFDPESVQLIRSRLGQALDAERLRTCADRIEDRTALRVVLRFFSEYRPKALLDALRLESRRERRRWLLLLLEAHGEPAREAAASRLRQHLGQAPDLEECYFRRNLLHLLRRIPRAGEVPLGEEVEFAIRHSRIGLPSFVIKEAVGLLGGIRDERAELVLIRLLQELEDMLPGRESFAETRNLPAIADRVAAALASFPTHRAHCAIMDYAETTHLESGRTMTALAGLGRRDLSADEATVDRLIGLIRRGRGTAASRTLLAPRTDEDHEHMVPVIEALAGTPLPVVRRTMEQIVRRYPERSSGRAAAKALVNLARREASV